MDNLLTINKQVKKAGYYFVGHFNAGYLRLVFDDCEIKISVEKKNEIFNLLEKIFEIDAEDGCWFEQITGKYCRLVLKELEIIAIGHIIENIFIPLEDLE